jgi:hypothetical protein
LIHLDFPFRAEEVALQLHILTAGTSSFTSGVHNQRLVAPDFQHGFARDLLLFVHALQFESVKPNPTTTALANVHGDCSDLQRGKLIETSWTFHDGGTL